MKYHRVILALPLAVAAVVCLAASADPPTASDQRSEDRHDFVFFAEARPVLIGVHVRLNGKPLDAAWHDFVKHVFTGLDLNGNGVLSRDEAERVPAVDQILSGGIGRAFGGIAMGKGNAKGSDASLNDIDTDKDGKVTLAELAAYYRKHGLTPLQFQPDSAAGGPKGLAVLVGGGRPEPKVEEVAEAIFALVDTNHDGKLSREELAAAPTVLMQRDEDDDEMLTAAEIVPNLKGGNNIFAMAMAANMGTAGSAKPPKMIVPIAAPGEVPPNLVRRLQESYGPAVDEINEKKLSRADLGLDEATFARLDTNGDGVLDAQELANFTKRAPDVELVLHVGAGDAGEPRVAMVARQVAPMALASKLRLTHDVARLDLGKTRVDLRTTSTYQTDRLSGILRQQLMAQFRQADKDNNGYLDEKEARASRVFASLYRAIDRDRDGKIYEHEVVAYLDEMVELQRRAQSACVSVVLTNQSRGLFDLLDLDRDGRLSVRELRGAVKLLDQLDTERKGYLVRADLPHSHQLTFRRGPATSGPIGGAAAFFDLYRTTDGSDAGSELTAGPLWFRKMDRNRDGDVSRKEFLGTDEQFRQIDTDGDGLISAAEAARFDALMRKQK
jgi:Ca2+-binding EF-hand superfamily protein